MPGVNLAHHAGDRRVAFLDQYAPAVWDEITAAVPPGWTWTAARSLAPDDQRAAVAGADAIFCGWPPVGADLLAAAAPVRLVHKLGAGVDKIDRDACEARGVAVARVAGGNAVPVAEHTVLLMLAALRRLPLVDRRTRAGEWLKEEARGVHRQLHAKRVGLIGLGAIGREVAQRLRGFDVELVYHDVVQVDPATERALGLRHLELDELVVTSDVVSLHAPLLPTTRHLLDARRIGLMKPHAVVVNCARGGLVDEQALATALREGRLLGAGLDTFATEPPVGSPLLTLENTVLTTHLAGATVDNVGFVIGRAFANATTYLQSGTLPAGDAVFVPARPARPA